MKIMAWRWSGTTTLCQPAATATTRALVGRFRGGKGPFGHTRLLPGAGQGQQHRSCHRAGEQVLQQLPGNRCEHMGKGAGVCSSNAGTLGEAQGCAHMCVGREVTAKGLGQGGGDSGGGSSVSAGRSGWRSPARGWCWGSALVMEVPRGAGGEQHQGVRERCKRRQAVAVIRQQWETLGAQKAALEGHCHPLPKPGTSPGSHHPAQAKHHVRAPQELKRRLG